MNNPTLSHPSAARRVGTAARQPASADARRPRPGSASRTDAAIEALASAQHGVVTRAQMRAAGVSQHTIDHRLRAGRLRLLHRGVYQVGPLLVRSARELAAVLACGETAVMSHASAAAAHELHRPFDGSGPVHVTVTGCDRGRRPGIRVHCVRALHPDERVTLHGIPTTSAARTLLDIAPLLTPRELEHAFAAAEGKDRAVTEGARVLTDRYPRQRGSRLLRAILQLDAPAFTRSEAESRLLTLIERAELPLPTTNVRVRGFEVDMYWDFAGLIIEIDGEAFHGSRVAFERDRRRDAVLAAAGVRTIRVPWRQLTGNGEATLVRLAQALVR